MLDHQMIYRAYILSNINNSNICNNNNNNENNNNSGTSNNCNDNTKMIAIKIVVIIKEVWKNQHE